ncbi:hypothetical protein AVEN_5463-1 [Araneus ventricosus]|uniref:Uncharacterized protein n=1 Tax=Araneus ventricosus TaxID=182803 RepID=A0A4Y2DWB5_ARAVE|nr:hypothetical protein AVEN_141378-1 [Araneus ventricosus]GBM21150.1 hypothetical protein AVEN_5463-1 [Araneus ventricosus]
MTSRIKRPPAGVVRKFGEGVPVQVSSSSSERYPKRRGESNDPIQKSAFHPLFQRTLKPVTRILQTRFFSIPAGWRRAPSSKACSSSANLFLRVGGVIQILFETLSALFFRKKKKEQKYRLPPHISERCWDEKEFYTLFVERRVCKGKAVQLRMPVEF